MSAGTDLLRDAFSRVREQVHRVLKGIEPRHLASQLDGEANSIAWLVWHLTRVQDDHMADVMGREQVWTADDWVGRFGLPFPREATGFGQSAEEVAALGTTSSGLLLDYYDAVHARTIAFLDTLADEDFARVVDTTWTPPVTLGVRLVSVISDDLQHVGQAAFVRGVVERTSADGR
jgi:uncharacterized damage-inducible protein DinB